MIRLLSAYILFSLINTSAVAAGRCLDLFIVDAATALRTTISRAPLLRKIQLKELSHIETLQGPNRVFWARGWGRKSDQTRLGSAILDQKEVFLKKVNPDGPNELDLIRAINVHGVGPQLLGAVTKYGETWMVLEFIEGVIYKPLQSGDFNNIHETNGYEVNPQIPTGFKINLQTVADVNLAFDVLNQLHLVAFDAQFILTREGRAVLIDLEYYVPHAQAESFNNQLRSIFIEGLTLSPRLRASMMGDLNLESRF